jgi:nodulation protein E
MHRVVITGLGCLTPIGNTPDGVWQSLAAGRTGIAPHGLDDPTLKFKRLGQISDLDVSSLSASQVQTTERCSQLALLAARQAVGSSGLLGNHTPERIAIILGCSTNGRQAEEPETARLYMQNARVHPLTVARSMASNGTSQVAIDHGLTGPALTISTACSSGAHAIGLAFHMVRSGMVSAALAGAHEAPLTRGFLRAWDSMRVVSPTTCRPFAANRDGMILAEGAAILALETLEAAQLRGADIIAEIAGFGMSTDAHHMTQPTPAGPAQAIRAALLDAGCDPEDNFRAAKIAYINAHGTATQANDATEAAALHLALGPRAASIPLSSTKGFHGHAMGASSAIEAMITALALHHGELPFTLGTTEIDPKIALDVIADKPRVLAAGPALALSNSLAFGGLNAVLVLRPCQ